MHLPCSLAQDYRLTCPLEIRRVTDHTNPLQRLVRAFTDVFEEEAIQAYGIHGEKSIYTP